MSKIMNAECAFFEIKGGTYARIQRDGESPIWYDAPNEKLHIVPNSIASILEKEYQKQKEIDWQTTREWLRENKDKFNL